MDYATLLKYTQNTCTPSEKEEIAQWLATHTPETDASCLQQLWGEPDTQANAEITEASLQHLLQRIEVFEEKAIRKRKSYTLIYTSLLRIAGLLILPLLASWLTWQYRDSVTLPEVMVNNIEYSALLGERKTITLPDSTRVCLNSGSVLITPDKFTGDRRNVFLLGEAYFEVAKNKEKPFIVTTSLMEVEALGTKFCISAFQNEQSVRTTLTEGSVRVSSTQEDYASPVVLQPNQQSYYAFGMNQIQVETVNIELYTAWKDGQFIFEETPFADVVKRLEVQFGVEIRYNDNLFKADKINARYIYNESLPDILQSLSQIAYFQYTKEGNNYQLRKVTT